MTPWPLIYQGYFPTACIWCIANMSPARLLGRSARPICPLITAVRLLLPCAPCVPSLREFVPATLWLRSPLERGHILFPARANLHGWHVTHGIVYQFGRVHIALVAEARSDLLLPSDPVSQHRTGIVSSSLDPGSTAERISSSLALCPTFDLASALSSGSNFGWSLFFCPALRRPSPYPPAIR